MSLFFVPFDDETDRNMVQMIRLWTKECLINVLPCVELDVGLKNTSANDKIKKLYLLFSEFAQSTLNKVCSFGQAD